MLQVFAAAQDLRPPGQQPDAGGHGLRLPGPEGAVHLPVRPAGLGRGVLAGSRVHPHQPAAHRLLGLEEAIQWLRNDQEYILGPLRFKVPRDAGAFARQLGERFPAEAAGIRAFFAEMLLVYREMYSGMEQTGGAPCPPRTVADLLAYPRTCPHAYR
jgi:hypothetical protein